MPSNVDLLDRCRLEVESSFIGYAERYSSVVASTETIGIPWSQERIATEIEAMRKCLVEPCWTTYEKRDTFEEVGLPEAEIRKAILLADDKQDSCLLYDPQNSDYPLAVRFDGRLSSIGVRGDAIGCFLAR